MPVTRDNWMNQPVMLFNVTYEPLEEVPATRAVLLLQQGAAVSHSDVEPLFPIRSQHLTIPLPRAVVLTRYVMVQHHVVVHDSSNASAAGVLRRDKSQCGYCGGFADTIDHVMPKSRGGPNTWSNLVAACLACNLLKADRTPEEAGMRLLWPPKAPRWDEKNQRQLWKTLAEIDAERAAPAG